MEIEIATQNIASFDVKEIQKEYPNISTSDFDKLVSIVPLDLEENSKYDLLKKICEWFLNDIAVPIIKEYVKNLIKKNK